MVLQTIIKIATETLKWNQYKSEKISKDFINNILVFEVNPANSNYKILKQECIDMFLDTYN